MNVKYPSFKTNKKTSREMAKSAEKICLSLAIAILADVYDFDDNMILDFTKRYIELADSLRFGTDTIDGIKQAIKEQYNIDI